MGLSADPASVVGQDVSALAYTQDLQEVLLLDPYSHMVVDMVARVRASDAGWTYASFDVTRWRGRTLHLYINCYNDGVGGRTWMYVDDVSLVACY
jgi:hypothetical protein